MYFNNLFSFSVVFFFFLIYDNYLALICFELIFLTYKRFHLQIHLYLFLFLFLSLCFWFFKP